MQKVVDILEKAMAHGQSITAPSQIYECAVRISVLRNYTTNRSNSTAWPGTGSQSDDKNFYSSFFSNTIATKEGFMCHEPIYWNFAITTNIKHVCQ